MGVSNKLTYPVHCPHCDYATPQTIAWLTVHNNMPCNACGRTVNLESGEIAVVIESLAQECTRLDAVLSKLD